MVRCGRHRGEHIDQRTINKHRDDVFRLAAILSGDAVSVPSAVRDDVWRFLGAFPDDDPSWSAILAAMGATFGRQVFRPTALRGVLEAHYGLRA